MLNYLLNDRIFVSYICPICWFLSAIVVFFLEVILDIKASYGRYNSNNSGIPARLAWFIQELPSFFVPCYLLVEYWSLVTTTKFLLISFFLIHYFQRYVKHAPCDSDDHLQHRIVLFTRKNEEKKIVGRK